MDNRIKRNIKYIILTIIVCGIILSASLLLFGRDVSDLVAKLILLIAIIFIIIDKIIKLKRNKDS